ncbi:DMT family transporter [Patescibacteria group bacterium]
MITASKGLKFAFLTALISGVSIFINKFAVGSITPPLVFTAVKNSLVGILILVLLLRSGKLKMVKDLNRKDLFKLMFIGIIGGALPFYLFFTGISQIPAVNAALIHKSLVIWIAILAWPLLKEKFSKTQGIAILLVLVGNLFIGGFKGFVFSKGELFVLLATLLWAIENIIAKKTLKNVDPDILVGARMGLGSLILIGTSLLIAPESLKGIFSLNTTQYFWLGMTALTLFAYVSTWYRALSFAPAITVATVLSLSTIVTNLLTAIFITHSFNATTFVPQVLIISLGIFVYYLSSRENTKKSKVSLR